MPTVPTIDDAIFYAVMLALGTLIAVGVYGEFSWLARWGDWLDWWLDADRWWRWYKGLWK